MENDRHYKRMQHKNTLIFLHLEALLEDSRLIYSELSYTAKLIKENAAQAQNQEEYLKKYESLAQRVEKLKTQYEILQQKRERRLYQADTLSAFMFALRELDILDIKFTPTLWHTTVDKVTVNADESIMFHFKNGSEVTV